MAESGERAGVRIWMVATGVLLVAIGFAFLLVPLFSTMVAGIAAGLLLFVTGVAQIADAFGHRGAGRAWAVAAGLLATIAGVLLLVDPAAGVLGLTALLAGYLVVAGVFRLALALAWRPSPGWVWALVNGIAALALALLVIVDWPATARWTLGVFLAVDTVLAGFGRVAYGIAEVEPRVPGRGRA
jgi:uncharacterized membrane protein HdeD (DUF308 family)